MYEVVSDLGSLNLDYSKPVFVDTETGGTRSVTKELLGHVVTKDEEYVKIVTIQVFQEHWDKVKVFIISELPSYSVEFIWNELKQCKLVGHNFGYDLLQFKKHGLDVTGVDWEDTFYASRLAKPSWQKYSLDKCLTKVLGYDPYAREGLNKKDMQKSFSPDSSPTVSQLVYASVDVYLLPKLYHAVVPSVQKAFNYILDKKTVDWILTDTHGMPVDLDELKKLEDSDIATIAEIDEAIPNLNVNSYMQVRKALGTVMSSDEIALQIIQNRPNGLSGLYLRVKMGPGGWPKALRDGIDSGSISVEVRSFGKATAITSSSQLPTSSNSLVYYMESSYKHSEEKIKLAKLINAKRKALKRLNFVKRAIKFIEFDEAGIPRISGEFSPHAINGRIQVDNENLSQYPRAMKTMWGHPKGNGRKLLYCDFAQIELRIICAVLPEMNMYKALKEGKDLHTFVAEKFNFSEEQIARLPAGQNPRQVAKQSNFLLLYGGGKTNFQKVVCRNSGVWFEDDMVSFIVDTWQNIFSDIKAWHERNSKSTTKMDVTAGGRKYKASIVTDLNNVKVSGTGSEIFKLWLNYIHKFMLPHLPDTYIVNRVHDAVYIDLPDDPKLYEPAAEFLTKLAQKAWFEVTKTAALTDVPMPTNAGVGSNLAGIDYGYDVDFEFVLDPYYMMTRSIDEEQQKFLEELNNE